MIVDLKFLFACISGLITICASFPYLRDVFQKKTRPHTYTWLIWAITQATAASGIWIGGGSFGAGSLLVDMCFTTTIFLASLKFGTKNITKTDTLMLCMALLAILFWWQLHNPLLSVITVAAIDGIGYIPTLRKSFSDPWGETLSYWAAMIASCAFGLLANAVYNPLTTTYLATVLMANAALFLMCLIRRRVIPSTYRG